MKDIKVTLGQLADYINSLPEDYTFEDSSDELWDSFLYYDVEVKGWVTKDPTRETKFLDHLASEYLPKFQMWLESQEAEVVLKFRVPRIHEKMITDLVAIELEKLSKV